MLLWMPSSFSHHHTLSRLKWSTRPRGSPRSTASCTPLWSTPKSCPATTPPKRTRGDQSFKSYGSSLVSCSGEGQFGKDWICQRSRVSILQNFGKWRDPWKRTRRLNYLDLDDSFWLLLETIRKRQQIIKHTHTHTTAKPSNTPALEAATWIMPPSPSYLIIYI